MLNRDQIENQMKTYVGDGVTPQNKPVFKSKIGLWLTNQGISDLDRDRILSDLESYSTFINLSNT